VSRYTSVSIVTEVRAGRPGLYSREREGFSSLRQIVHAGSGAQPASYPMGIKGFFSGNKAAGA
jgi:hypothetical protein